MIQLQAINNILNTKDIEPYLQANMDRYYFSGYEDEFEFILEHYNKYAKIPDDATFFNQFPDFTVVEVLEPVDYIVENLKENYLYEQGVNLFTKSARLLEQNSFEGLQHIRDNAEKLLQNTSQSPLMDINSHEMTEIKLKDIEEKRNRDGMIGVSSGLPELDKILGGWLPGEELVVVLGRINQGKSWILEKFATEANKQGKKVLYYSGEMGTLQVAYRNDTLGSNFSNRQLMRGTMADGDLDIYIKQINENTSKYPPFYVVTPRELGASYLSISKLKTLLNTYKPDIIVLDQLSLMEDDKKGENTRLRLANITADLFNLSTTYKIPIIAASQANRNKANMENPENPELSDISESDAIGQNASRVISLVQTKLGLSLKITKNRYGDNNHKLIYAWDIDNGTFRYVDQEDSDLLSDGLKPRNSKKDTNNPTDIF